ncbi:MAG: molybdopterin-guanine dinucleotide biosynthesis protein MobA, partial [Firmicutes bacterium]|nr:molybdopterin-guanine dinucleotide biosynthesis protein MobA [Bacillota bacterium]
AGHPVVLDRSAAQMLLSYKGLDGMRGFLRQLEADAAASFVRVIETDDPGILADVDTPEDYQKWNK